MQLTFICLWTFLGLLVGLFRGPRPINATKSSSISFVKSWTENFLLSILLLLLLTLMLLLNLDDTYSPPATATVTVLSTFAGEGESRCLISVFLLVLILHDFKVSLSSSLSSSIIPFLKIVSFNLSVSIFRSCNSFFLTTAIPSSSSSSSPPKPMKTLLRCTEPRSAPPLVEEPLPS